MEAYRRLAAVTTIADVDDVRAEWDRPLRTAAAAGGRAARRRPAARRGAAPRHPRGLGAEETGALRRARTEEISGGAAASRSRPRARSCRRGRGSGRRRGDASKLIEGLLGAARPDRSASKAAPVPSARDPSKPSVVSSRSSRSSSSLQSSRGCSSTLRDAATVTYNDDDTETTVNIRRNDFDEQVEDLSESDQIMQSVADRTAIEATPEGTADARLSAFWLTTLLNSVAVDAEFEARDLEVTDDQREQVAASYESLDDLPEYLVDMLIDQQARAAAVAADAGKDVPDRVRTDRRRAAPAVRREPGRRSRRVPRAKRCRTSSSPTKRPRTRSRPQLDGGAVVRRRSRRAQSTDTGSGCGRAAASVASARSRSSRRSSKRPTRPRSTRSSGRCRPSSATT